MSKRKTPPELETEAEEQAVWESHDSTDDAVVPHPEAPEAVMLAL